jgi:sulfoacetaldehyde acetyltransferase
VNDWPPITMVIFRNYQWGAEKRNTTLWFDDNFVGTELDLGVEYAEDCGRLCAEGRSGATMDQLTEALKMPSKAR